MEYFGERHCSDQLVGELAEILRSKLFGIPTKSPTSVTRRNAIGFSSGIGSPEKLLRGAVRKIGALNHTRV